MAERDAAESDRTRRAMWVSERWFSVIGLVVLVAGGIGFISGVNPSEYRAGGLSGPSGEPAQTGSEPARSHRVLSQRPWGSGPQASWAASVDRLQRRAAAPAPVPASAAARSRARAQRARGRSFRGAPPVVPHPIAGTTSDGCLGCHRSGLQLGALSARPIPHAERASCTQCHVASAASGPALEPAVSSRSRFAGLEAPGAGERAWPGAPPVLPHRVQMRENCLSCHGPLGLEGLRTPHPERRSCLQCHALSAALERGGPR